MYEKLLKIVTGLGHPKVLVIGDFMLDVYVYGDALRISPEAPVPVLRVTNTEYRCGGAGSVAADLAALQAAPYCVGIIGDDRNGKILKNLLLESNADTDGLLSVPERPTIAKQRLIGLAQHRHQQQLFRMDEESTEPVSDDYQQKLLYLYRERLELVDIVCLQDYNKGLLCPSFCQELIKLAVRAGKKILVDPAMTNDYSKYNGATLVTPNRQETATVVGFDIRSADDAAKAAEQLVRKLNLEAAVITLDKEGAYVKTKTLNEIVPTRPRNVYDVTGAGDMVLATLAAALAADCDYKTAVQLANITGGIEVEKFGTATVTIDEIINELVSQNRGKTGKLYVVALLVEELNWCRKQKKTVVFTNGCFDVIHRGHIEFLRFCKLQGDIVVVGLNSDSSVQAIKGPERPINSQDDRAAVLTELESIDYITIFDESTPLKLIKKVRPDVLVKGRDWAKEDVVGREFVESCGGKVVLAPFIKGKSSTATIKRMKCRGLPARDSRAGRPRQQTL